MTNAAIKIGKKKKSIFLDTVKEILPNGNLSLCLTCGLCSSGCPATGLDDMDPRKFLRMAVFGLDEELLSTNWVWHCTGCQRCIHACPMAIDIPRLVYLARAARERDARPLGLVRSCDMALKNDCNSAMGTPEEDFRFVVNDVLEQYQEEQPEFADMQAPIDKEDAMFFLNQNSREPVTEPDEMVPLWKILHTVGADWTYGSKGWGGENYCMFLADDDAWKTTVSKSVGHADALGCKTYLNTE